MNMMQTQSGGAGAFARFDLSRVPSPCFVVDEAALTRNLEILANVKERSGAKVLLALKAFSMFTFAPLVMRYLDGVCASGIYEAKLGREAFQCEVTTYSAAYKPQDIAAISNTSNHVIFNTPAQFERFRESCRGNSLGLRLNPEHSEGKVAKYDPCAPCSRLGTPISLLDFGIFDEIDGIHMHTLCEQGFEPLLRTWQAIEPRLAPHLSKLKWINFGGGHHITRADYNREALIAFLNDIRIRYDVEVFIEPGEAVALDTGILVGEVLDLPQNSMNLAITDISATCHMPDVIEAPYRPAMLDETEQGTTYRFGGPSCLAGDVIGDYTRRAPLTIGERIAFLDQAHYSMVKTNTFNGIPLPSIAIWNSDTDELRMVKEFGYNDFRERLS